MKSKPERERHERQDWGIVLLILLLGFCCVIFAGQYALRFAPSWQVDTNMESNIDLNSEFLTNKPVIFFEPVDPAILTQPVWVNGNVFLTPGADFDTGTPLPPPTATVPTDGTATIPVATNTIAVTNTTIPTNTLVWIPLPATKTSKPGGPANTPTNTSSAPLPSAELGITVTDNTTAYVAGDPRTYIIVISNIVAGSSNVVGATVQDFFPAEVTVDSGSCAPAGGATCGAWAGSGDINDVVNLPFGSSITYTVNVTLGSGTIINTAQANLPPGYLGTPFVSATDRDDEIVPPPGGIQVLPPGVPDGSYYDLPGGSTLTLAINLTADGNTADWDLVYYELLNFGPPDYILLDWVVIEISDGYNWYKIFDWGNGIPDANTNVAGITENDQEPILTSLPLYNTSGVAIDIDSIVPPGSYPYIRFISSPYGAGADGGRTDIDAIEIFP